MQHARYFSLMAAKQKINLCWPYTKIVSFELCLIEHFSFSVCLEAQTELFGSGLLVNKDALLPIKYMMQESGP